jgi:hypothetical protein
VTLGSLATGLPQTTTTGANGIYRFSVLPPGNYTIKFSAKGFKTTDVPLLAVNVTEISTQNAKLEVGATDQQVMVTAEAETLQTESSGVGTLVQSRDITSLPLTTRNYTQILSMSAGVTAIVQNASTLGAGSIDMNVNGQQTISNNYQLDGADANSWSFSSTTTIYGPEGGILPVPNPDAIEEFKIQTAQYDAGYGRNPGANVDVVTKSGTNSYHGSVFEFLRNDALDANDYFLNATGEPRGAMKQNQFGGVFGGPIKKDKLFLFVSYQETRQVNGICNTGTTDAGGLSCYSSAILPPLTTPADRTAAGLGALYCNQPTFAGGVQVACDGSNINPVALQIVQAKLPNGNYIIPTPQSIISSGANAGQGFSSFSEPAFFKEHQGIINTDYAFSPSNRLSEKFFYSSEPETVNFLAPTNVPGFPTDNLFLNLDAGLKLTTTLTPQLVNEVHATINRAFQKGEYGNPVQAATYGVDPFNPQALPLMPGFVIAGMAIFNGDASDTVGYDEEIQETDQLSWIHGKHSVRFGGFFEFLHEHENIPGRSIGGEQFLTFQDFLLGMSAAQNGSPNGYSNVYSVGGGGNPFQVITGANDGSGIVVDEKYGGAFIQDDYKVNSRLTLNLGVRWEYIGDMYEPNGKFGALFPSLMAAVPIPPASGTLVGWSVPANYNPNASYNYGLPAGVIVRPFNGVGLTPTSPYNFGPRLGFAWQPGSAQSRLVVRGGYGIFYQLLPANGTSPIGPTETNPPYGLSISRSGASNAAATLQDTPQYPNPGVVPLGWQPRYADSTRSDLGYATDQKNPAVQEWSLNTQYALANTWTLELGYVGNRGSKLPASLTQNIPQLASPANPLNCGYDGVPTDCITTNTPQNARYRAPILGEIPGAATAFSFREASFYNAMQVTLRKRFSRGLTLQASYTWSKAEGDSPIDETEPNVLQWSRLSFDRTQRLILNYNYELPTPFQSNALSRKTLGGWSVSGVATFQAGAPLTLLAPTGGTIYGLSSTVELCPGVTNSTLKNNAGNDQARLTSWFNPAAICPNPVIGTGTGYGNSGDYIVNGPGNDNWDISLAKLIKVGGIREDGTLLFRTEFYNAFNHPQFSAPGTYYGLASFGAITSTSVAARLIQFGLKYSF